MKKILIMLLLLFASCNQDEPKCENGIIIKHIAFLNYKTLPMYNYYLVLKPNADTIKIKTIINYNIGDCLITKDYIIIN